MAHRSHSFLVSAAFIPLAYIAAVACSSSEPDSTNDSSATTSTTTSTVTSTATQTSATVSSTTVTNTVATTASTTTATSASTSGASTTGSTTTGSATTGSATTSSATTGSATTGTGGTTSSSSSSGAGGAGGTGTTGGNTEFTLTSPAFADDGVCSAEAPDTCELFPRENSSFHDNESPELNWTAGPEGTLSYVVVMYDLSIEFAHWVVWNLSAETLSLPAALPGDGTLTTPVSAQQISLGQGDGYFGPGSCENVYEFKVYALDVETFTPDNTTMLNAVRTQLEESENVLDTATLRGRANPDDC